MESLGQLLRDARVHQGLGLDDVERATHIRTKHLAALEAGDLQALPSPVQARGFLRNYARLLGLDADELGARFDLIRPIGPAGPVLAAAASRPPTPSASPARGTDRAYTARRWFSMDLLVGAVVTIALLAVFVWGGARLATAIFDGADATPAASRLLEPTSTFAAFLAALELDTPTPPPLESYTNVQLTVRVHTRAWLKVWADGREVFVGRAAPGESLEFTGNRVVEILTSNAAGLQITFNGRDQGSLGEVGEVVRRLWTLEGMVIPTPSAVPAATVES